MLYDYNDYELIYLVREENEEAINLIIKKYDPIIKSLASYYITNFKNLKLEYDDLVQEGRLALVICLNKYNNYKEVLFYSFVIICIKRKFINIVRNALNNKHFSLNYSISLDDDNTKEIGCLSFDFIEEQELIRKINRFKHNLNELDSCIFELKFNGFSYLEISTLLDINKKTVDNHIYKIQKLFRKYLLKYEEITI